MRCCFITLGCRVNQYESDAMAELLREAGWEVTDDPSVSDLCIINTCTVTNIADRKSRQMISKAHRLNENAKLIACGCFTQRSPEEAKRLSGVDAVLGSADKNKIVEIAAALFENEHGEAEVLVRDVMREREFEELSATREGRTRAYLKIQDGCNMFCTYCAIPYARGAIRSRRLESVRNEAEKLNEEGYAEVVLTGIHLMSYGRDFGDGTNILDAVKCFDGLENIKRIRFGSLEPHMMTDEIISGLAANERICRQFHLALQSGSTTVLDRMKRGYTAEQFYALTVKLRAAFGEGLALTTDIIAGFPGETEEEHRETLAFMEKVGFSKVHIFPYSRRSGTKADGMSGQLTNAVKSERAKELIEKGRELEMKFLKTYIGSTVSVLIEENEGGKALGCTDTYAKVAVGSHEEENTFVNVLIDSVSVQKDGEIRLLGNKINK
ncbi:MAG: tRNA (N(6)-L-threonylcarbamoyladenosine(37)-C(2))-methylthiotransferase MtaB [Clostridiales bacterium]|nr:tRNA (N(6)-L-threonylcarbamoyladenosine(37)-C(2))-methylthiotransferase MtaB [Clostridiales bacterium]MDD7523320.1 tRNA (N(6)-L-threonylcarbamoyladenosine(37)-C(2))-methylthiotransferase MtaB [Clostridiales bacterium]